MKSTVLSDLEKDYKFKRVNTPLSVIYKNILILAPVLLLFIGLLGILYLLDVGKLISFYSIYYIVCFMLGTIWLKSIRQYIVKKEINKKDAYLACWAVPLSEDKKNVHLIFTTGERRHDKYFIENIKKNAEEVIPVKKTGRAFPSDYKDEQIFIVSLQKSLIKRRNPNWDFPENLPVLYVDSKYVVPISGRYLY